MGRGGGISVSEFSDFSAAIDSSATSGKTIVVDRPITLTRDTTITGRSIKIIHGGSINIPAGKTLTIPFPEAGGYQIFTGDGNVVFAGAVAGGYILPQWWGAKGDGSITNEEKYINKAFIAAAASGCQIKIPAGVYKTSGPIRTKVPFVGADGMKTRIRPQGTFAAFDILVCSSGTIGDFLVDFRDVGSENITSDCIGLRLMNESNTRDQQIVFTKFKNIEIMHGYHGVYYNALADTQGQLYMVSFDHVSVTYNAGTGFHLKSTSGSLSVSLDQCSVDAPRVTDGFWRAYSATARGYYLHNIGNVTLKNCIASCIQSDAAAKVAYFGSIHSLTLTSFQHENTAMRYGGRNSGPIGFYSCEQVDLDIRNQTPRINTTGKTIASYLFFDHNCRNIIIRSMAEQGVDITTGVRKFFSLSNVGLPAIYVSVLDGTISRNDCYIPTAVMAARVQFMSEDPSLTRQASAKRAFTYHTTIPGTSLPTSILDLAPYGISTTSTAGLFVVNGTSRTDPSRGFVDLVMVGAAGNTSNHIVVAISSNAINGYATPRKYTRTNTDLFLASSSELSVNVTGFSMTGTPH